MTTLQQVIYDFITEQQVRGNSEKTIKYYQNVMHKFTLYTGNIDINDITLPMLRSYVISLRESELASTSVQTYVRGLRAFLRWCFETEYLNRNLAEKLRLPKACRPEIDTLTDDECKRLLSCFDASSTLQLRDLCICALMLDSGLRLSEVVTLRTACLHINEAYAIVLGKGNKERTVPLGLTTRKYLAKYLRRRPKFTDSEYLFVKSDGCPVARTTIKQLFRKLKSRAAIPRLHPHLLRHTFATNYLANGGDVFTLQSLMGHATLDMTRRYVHLTTRKSTSTFHALSPIDNLA